MIGSCAVELPSEYFDREIKFRGIPRDRAQIGALMLPTVVDPQGTIGQRTECRMVETDCPRVSAWAGQGRQ